MKKLLLFLIICFPAIIYAQPLAVFIRNADNDALITSMTLCNGADNAFFAQATGGTPPYTYSWTNPGGQVSPTNKDTITFTAMAPGTYNVIITVSDVHSNTAKDTLTMTVNPVPAVTLTSSADPSDIICAGTSVTFTGSSAVLYTFYQGKHPGLWLQGPGTDTYTTSSLINGDSIFMVGQNSFNCTDTSSIIAFTVNPLPNVYTVTGGGAYCSGGSGLMVGLSSSDNGINYQLYLNQGSGPVAVGSPLAGTGAALNFGNQTLAGTYTVIGVNTVTSCQNSMGSVAISINPLPLLYTVTGGGSYCAGDSGINVGLNNSQSGVTYQLWINNGTGSYTDTTVTGNGTGISFGNQTTAGTYTVIATNMSTTCKDTMPNSITIIVNNTPALYDVTGGGNYCSGGAGVPVGLSNSQSGINYQLIVTPPGNVLLTLPGTGSALNFGYQTHVGTYTINAVNTNTTCTKIMNDSVVVAILPAPVAFAGNDTSICQWSSFQLQGSGAGVNGTYLWSPSTGLNSTTTSNPVCNPTYSITYFLTVTDSSGCSATSDINLSVIPFALPTITSPDTGFCTGIPVNATLDAGTGYAAYLWNTMSTNEIINVTTPATYTVTVADADGCSAVASKSVVVYPMIGPAVILANGPLHFCQPDTVTLSLNLLYSKYEWSSGGSNTADIHVAESGFFSVTVTDSNGCIYHAGPDTVIVDPLPHAIMSYVDKDSALTFDFYNVSLYSTSCKWNFGDPSTGSLNTSFSNDTLHVYTSPGKYTVELIVMNNCGSDTTFDTINVHKPNTGINQIEELSGLFLYPNPAKDFVNLNFILDKPKQLSITLYNALGQKMYFENVSYNSGIHHEEINLESLSKGVYIFRIFADEQTYNLKLIKN